MIDSRTDKKNFLPSAEILIEPNRHFTIYGSYSESFVPVDPGIIDLNGGHNFNPIEGKQYEVGIKAQNLFDGRFAATLALYRIDQVGQITQVNCDFGNCGVQAARALARRRVGRKLYAVQEFPGHFRLCPHQRKGVTADPDKQFQIGQGLPMSLRMPPTSGVATIGRTGWGWASD